MTEEELQFDVRKIPKPIRNENRSIDQNHIKNPYAKKYMEDKKTLVVKENIVGMLTNIKEKRNIKSTNDTIKFLCDLEKKLTDVHMIKEFAVCEDCGVLMSPEHTKEVHSHVDKNSECFGCLQTEHRFNLDKNVILEYADKIRKQSGQTDTNDEKSEQTDKNDNKKDTNEKKDENEKHRDWVADYDWTVGRGDTE